MAENVKQYTAVFLLLLLFLFVVPTVSHGAVGDSSSAADTGEDSGGSSSPASYTFPAGTTVESLAQQLAAQGTDETLRVLKPDGSIRASGPIETGDRVEVLDESGQLLSCVIALVEAGSQTSSQQNSSHTASSRPDASSCVSLGQPEGNGYSVFSPGTTVESLQDGLDAAGAQGRLKVKSRAGGIRGSGNICTGDTLSLLDSEGNVLAGTKAVVPGDLTRCGVPTAEACDLLYSHLIRRSELTGDLLDAADINRDGTVDPRDLLLLKKSAENFN